MRVVIGLLAAFIFVGIANGQLARNELYFLQDSSTSKITFQGGYGGNSTAITNSFFQGIFQDGVITETLKQDVENKLKKENSWGQHFYGSIQYLRQLKDSAWTLSVDVGDQDIRYASFSDDLFSLVMRGNKPFAGQELDLNELTYSQFSYQHIGAGLSHWSEEQQILIGGGVSFIKGISMQQIDFQNATFFTESEGTYVDVSGDYLRYVSKPYDNRLSAAEGIGSAIYLHLVKSWPEKNVNLGFYLRDLGFVQWKGVKTFESESTVDVRFEGAEIDDFFDASGNAFDVDSIGSVEELLGINDTTGDVNVSLPATVEVQFQVELTKLKVLSGLRYIMNAPYDPRVYIRPVYQLSDKLGMSATAAIGGFGTFDFLLGTQLNLPSGLSLDLNANFVEALILPSRTTGLSVRLVASYSF